MTQKRTAHICMLYRTGSTQAAIAAEMNVTEARIGQILKRAGLVVSDRPTSRTGRTQYTALHLSGVAKDAVRSEADKDGVSMSAWIATLVMNELTRRGVDLTALPIYTGEPLPLEG